MHLSSRIWQADVEGVLRILFETYIVEKHADLVGCGTKRKTLGILFVVKTVM